MFLMDEDVIQLLLEAGCSDGFAQRFLAVMKTKSVKDQLRLLRDQRNSQLDRLHEEAKKLDRLDYLRYILERSVLQP